MTIINFYLAHATLVRIFFHLQVELLSVFDYLGEEWSELNWTKMHEKVFSGEISRGEI